jgi:deoxyribose-phosphate aldolase
LVEADIRAVVQASAGRLVKVIFETCYLTDAQIVTACKLSVNAGAGYVKTSTGFGSAGATAAHIALMRKTVGPDIGVKASGGVKTLEAALAMIEAGASRIGTSSGVDIVRGL